MLLKAWRSVTIMLAAMSMGMALCHALSGLRNGRCGYRGRCGRYRDNAGVSRARATGVPLDALGCVLSGERSRCLVALGRSGERGAGTVDERNPAVRLDAAARSMRVHACRARAAADRRACCARVLDEQPMSDYAANYRVVLRSELPAREAAFFSALGVRAAGLRPDRRGFSARAPVAFATR